MRKQVITKLEGMNLRYVARDSGVSYNGIYGLVSRGTAAYETILALYQYFEKREKEVEASSDFFERRKKELNAPGAQEISHIAARSENQHNSGLRKDNTSGYPGVCFDKTKNNYMAQIRVNGKLNYLGRYPTAEQAYLAYQLAKIEHHPSSPKAQEYLRELTLAG